MNRKQREKNKATARWLKDQQVCPECGERGRHYVALPMTLADLLVGIPPNGFWTCAKFYGPDGRRLGAERAPQPTDGAAVQR